MSEQISQAAFSDLLAHVNALTSKPVSEHAAVLENVHSKLRAALDPSEPESN